jgi:hypothetical protein
MSPVIMPMSFCKLVKLRGDNTRVNSINAQDFHIRCTDSHTGECIERFGRDCARDKLTAIKSNQLKIGRRDYGEIMEERLWTPNLHEMMSVQISRPELERNFAIKGHEIMDTQFA